MVAPYVGRNARFYKDGVVIAYGRSISVRLSAEAIMDGSMDSKAPALLVSGKQSYGWSIDRLFIDEAYATILTGGSTFTIIFAPTGVNEAPKITLAGCIITGADHSAGESGAVLERVSGEALTCTPINA
jgi:hypothetical protein